MPHRRQHQEEVRRYLQERFQRQAWEFSLPRGSGMETYFARGKEQTYFVKVGAQVERYLALANIDLTPPVIAYGDLEDGQSIMVQPFIEGWRPSPRDLCDQLKGTALLIHKLHHDSQVSSTLEIDASNLFINAGRRALARLCSKWENFRAQVPAQADFVDGSLEHLARQIDLFAGEGLVASHNDICNANWLFTSDEKIYLLDFESMSMDDPAADLGALLWWYYPPELRQRFLEIAGYCFDDKLRFRMRIRMAMHCLSIVLPREHSFDQFIPEKFGKSLRDFRAILEGKENPEGYLQ